MLEYVRLALVGFGLLFFLVYLAAAIYAVRFHSSRDKRLEAAGIAVPGVGGLLFAGGAWLPAGYTWAAAALWLLAVAFIVFGRFVYELIVFRESPGRRQDTNRE